MGELFPGAEMVRAATFSPCGIFRYTLERVWDPTLPRLLWILLNSSKADALQDDPTNRRGINFSKSWGFGSCVFGNLFAFQSPYPKVMRAAPDPIGPENDAHILEQAALADTIVLAWGANGGYLGRDRAVLKLLADGPAPELWCLGKTKAGHPKHPLYLKADTPLEVYT